jgi:hypothetical protein
VNRWDKNMAFRNGLISFLIIVATAFILIVAGIIILVKFRNGFDKFGFLSILLILIGITMMFFSKKMCIKSARLKEKINVTPLAELRISSNIKSVQEIIESIETLSSFEVNTSNSYGASVEVAAKWKNGTVEMLKGTDTKSSHLELRTFVFDTVENACNSYVYKYKNYEKNYGIMESSGTDNNRYFVTYKNQSRSSAETMYQLMDSCTTYVYFQKNNLLIELWEDKRTADTSKMESYINLLAKRLSKLDE